MPTDSGQYSEIVRAPDRLVSAGEAIDEVSLLDAFSSGEILKSQINLVLSSISKPYIRFIWMKYELRIKLLLS